MEIPVERARSPHSGTPSPSTRATVSPRSTRETMAVTDLRHPANAKLLEMLRKVVDDVHDFKDGRPRSMYCQYHPTLTPILNIQSLFCTVI